MIIEISGYKNLEKINFEITDKKINMLFGMSGSGKSSISSALLGENLDESRTIGADIHQNIKIDNNIILPPIDCFNWKSLEKYVISKSNEDVFNIFVDDKKKIVKAEKDLKNLLSKLDMALDSSREKYEEFQILKDELGSDLNKNGELKKTAKVIKVENSIEKIRNRKIIQQIQKMSIRKFKWIKDGMQYKDENHCPFCDHRLSKRKVKNLNDLNQFEEKSLGSVLKLQTEVAILNDSIDLSLKSIRKIKHEIITKIIAWKDIENLKNISLKVKEYSYKEWNENIILSNELKIYFPEIYRHGKNLINHLDVLKKLTEIAQKNTKKILSRRTNKINSYLEQMSIPYKLEAEYANGRIKSYKIIHINDDKHLDRSNSPSEGEKNIIALIMFIFHCKNGKDNLIIIDDPASSYDDFRRSQILKIIKNELKERTVLLLSHDEKFAKYAVIDKYYKNSKLYYFENYGSEFYFTKITRNDFGDFNDFVINRIRESTDYMQKIINLRLLYEGNNRTYAYGYLSAIIHQVSAEELNDILLSKNTTEQDVIKLIKEKYPELKDIDIPLYSAKVSCDLKNYSIIEKAIWAREKISAELEKNNLKDEMNEFAHINGKLKVCLNPYEYNFCTKRLYEYLKKVDV